MPAVRTDVMSMLSYKYDDKPLLQHMYGVRLRLQRPTTRYSLSPLWWGSNASSVYCANDSLSRQYSGIPGVLY